ncbi:MAG: carbamoyltransferase [Victivallaceae bacterium]|jgi:carbamoyltransferase
MNILGISAYYHDSAAALIRDGAIIAAAQEERFSRIKHDSSFPEQAMKFCMDFSRISTSELDYVVFYEKPLQKFDRLLDTYISFAPAGFSSFAKAIPLWLKQKMFIRREILKQLGKDFHGKLVFPSHHESHAASAFFPSPFEQAAILTLDGVGEWTSASIGRGDGNRIELLKEITFPHSVGLLYSAFTYYAGFKVNSGEYKLMGLAPYGKPVYTDRIMQLVKVHDDGSIRLDMSYFNYCQGLTMTSRKFHRLFGGPPRRPEAKLTQREMDIAASIQQVTEEIILKMARFAREITGLPNLCLAGGVALNCVANGRIVREKIFDNIWVQPAAGDAGGALGTAQFVYYQLLERKRQVMAEDSQQGSLLGPEYTNAQIKAILEARGATYEYIADEAELLKKTAAMIAAEKVIGWFNGRMEFGPRALGARSIIGDARSTKMQTAMNLKIKYRESFRPFAPCVLREDVQNYFQYTGDSPYMLMVAPLLESKRISLTPEQRKTMTGDPDLMQRLNVPRSEVPAITHIDYSARVQTVDESRHGRFYRLLKEFKRQTGCPIIINTSFNIRGEPIVNTPDEAYNCFINTDMDVLILGNYMVRKEAQSGIDETERCKYRNTFKLD